MKRKFSFFLFLVFLFSAHTWGQTWNLTPTMTAVLDNNGVLTISTTKAEGEAMPNYMSGTAPWFTNFGSIFSVIIKDKVISIGDFTFWSSIYPEVSLPNISSVSIPNSVKSIGDYSQSYYSS